MWIAGLWYDYYCWGAFSKNTLQSSSNMFPHIFKYSKISIQFSFNFSLHQNVAAIVFYDFRKLLIAPVPFGRAKVSFCLYRFQLFFIILIIIVIIPFVCVLIKVLLGFEPNKNVFLLEIKKFCKWVSTLFFLVVNGFLLLVTSSETFIFCCFSLNAFLMSCKWKWRERNHIKNHIQVHLIFLFFVYYFLNF